MRAERRATRARPAASGSSAAAASPWRSKSFTRAFWPLGSALAVVWAALAFGLAEAAHAQSACSSPSGWRRPRRLALLVDGLRRFRWPSRAAARARIDASLPGRPLAALRDDAGDRARRPGRAGGLGGAPRAHAAARRHGAAGAGGPAAREPRSLGAAAGGAGAADRGAGSSPATAASRRSRRRCSRRPGRRRPPGRASRAGPSRPPIPAARRSTCPRCPGGAPVTVPQGTVVTLRVYGAAERFELAEIGLRRRRPGSPRRRRASPRPSSRRPRSGSVALRQRRRHARRLVLRRRARPAADDRASSGRWSGRRPARPGFRYEATRRPRRDGGAGRDRARPAARSTAATAWRRSRSRASR